MTLKAIHDTLDEIPEQFRDLYSERGGRFELTGIVGVKTQADIDRLQTSLGKEREDHKTTKDRLQPWLDMDHADVMARLDRIPELEAAAKGALDQAQIDEIVNKRVDGTINSRVAPLDRQIKTLTKERDDAIADRDGLAAEKRQRVIHDAVRAALTKGKVIPEAHDDALLLAERVFEVAEDGQVVTRDQVGVTPGVMADVWLQEIQGSRPHWWPPSQGGGARGGNGGSGFAQNPFSAEHWNMTKQGEVQRQDPAKAEQMAKAAGTTVGGLRPRLSK